MLIDSFYDSSDSNSTSNSSRIPQGTGIAILRNRNRATSTPNKSLCPSLRYADLFADYPEVVPLELVGLSEERVEGLPHPLVVGRQRRHRERRHPQQPRLGVLQSDFSASLPF